jgi:hypothetical protein
MSSSSSITVRHWRDEGNDKRAVIVKPKNGRPKFRVGDTVYIQATANTNRDGPYQIERVLWESHHFTLCRAGISAKDGQSFSADELEN